MPICGCAGRALNPSCTGGPPSASARPGALPEALGHGAAAGDWEFTASALVDDLALGQFFTGPRADTLAALFSRMGQRGGDGPAPELVRAAARLSRGDLAGGAVRLGRARQLTSRYDDLADAAAARMGSALLEALTARLAARPAVRRTPYGRPRRCAASFPSNSSTGTRSSSRCCGTTWGPPGCGPGTSRGRGPR